ncbi:hypothetical protein EJ08DRAFT_390830 [Tothia fuscella]|uniref:Heterokaryon incompatibility domain-containing protein n=1 Tax=Tothia fuscella TaxID=1048955 RepID=A0A9P4P0Q1_9PEZI|nr:hypothetical protein EJ08DRAFT_390830 [Tothia fuscella]
MRSIYMFARSTIMWLGHGFAEVETLLNIIDLVTTSDALWTLCWKASPGNHLSPASHIFDALCTMAKFQYWSRAWVVQEIMFSQRVSVRYGSRRLKYDKLLDFWMAFVTTLDISGWKIANESDYKQSYAATLLETSGPAALPIPDSARNGSYFTVEQWLDYTDIKEASDRRDHVYAYYGCFHPTFREGMEIDYGKTSVQVNTQMTKLSIEALKHNALDIILRAEHTFKEPSQPSWVPSFGREGEARFRAPFGTRMVKKYKLNAGGPNNQAVRSAMTDIILSVRGVQIGTVNTFAMPLIEDAVDFKANDWFEGEDAIRATLIHFRQTWRSVRVPNCKNDVQSFIYSYLVRSVKAPDTTQQPQLVTFLQDMTKKPEEAVGYIKSMLFTGYHVGRRMFSYSWTQMPKTGGLGRETEMVTRFGLGPKEMITGDKVCVLLGCSIPVILRQLDGGHCIFIGGACVHGFMHGEAVDGKETEEFGIV